MSDTLVAIGTFVVPVGGFLLMIALLRLAHVRAVNGLLDEKRDAKKALDAHESSCGACKARAAVGFFAPACAEGTRLGLIAHESEVRFYTRGQIPRFFTRHPSAPNKDVTMPDPTPLVPPSTVTFKDGHTVTFQAGTTLQVRKYYFAPGRPAYDKNVDLLDAGDLVEGHGAVVRIQRGARLEQAMSPGVSEFSFPKPLSE